MKMSKFSEKRGLPLCVIGMKIDESRWKDDAPKERKLETDPLAKKNGGLKVPRQQSAKLI